MRRVFQIVIVCAMLLYGLAVTAAPHPYAAVLKAYRGGQYATACKTLVDAPPLFDSPPQIAIGALNRAAAQGSTDALRAVRAAHTESGDAQRWNS